MFIFKPYIVLHFVLVKSHTYCRSLNTNLLNLFRLYLKLEKPHGLFYHYHNDIKYSQN